MKRLFAVAGLLLGLAGPAYAGEEPQSVLTTADSAAIHDTVKAQLEALAEEDAAAAFELATLEKQLLIGSPDNFLLLMRELYEPIYRNKALIFYEPEVIDGTALQTVRVTDSYSRVWLAVFWMQQDDELNWKIDGCHLIETPNISV